MLSDLLCFYCFIIKMIPDTISCGEWGTFYDHQNVFETDRYGRGLIVLVGVMCNRRTPIHIFDGGTVTSQPYCTEIILGMSVFFVLLLVQTVCSWMTVPVRVELMSNARHTSREEVLSMVEHTYSLDLNSMEHIWDRLDTRVT